MKSFLIAAAALLLLTAALPHVAALLTITIIVLLLLAIAVAAAALLTPAVTALLLLAIVVAAAALLAAALVILISHGQAPLGVVPQTGTQENADGLAAVPKEHAFFRVAMASPAAETAHAHLQATTGTSLSTQSRHSSANALLQTRRGYP
jgi:hypothetical protein